MPDTPTPLVTVVVPAFQAAGTIAETLTSLLGQSIADWEAVVVDDGSTDGTLDVVAGFAEADPRISVVSQANAGVSAARNAGLLLARGEWLLFLDADDRVTPDALAALLAPVHAGVDWVHGGWVRIVNGVRQRVEASYPINDPVRRLAVSCPFVIHGCLLRTAAVRNLDGFDTTLVTCEDWDLWRRLAQAGHRPISVDALVAEYVVRGESASMAAAQLLRDGLWLIEVAHAEANLPDSARRAAQAAFCAYAAGITIGQGRDPAWVLEQWAESAPDTDPAALADMLYAAVPLGALASAEAWPIDAATFSVIRRWIADLEHATGGLRLEQCTAVHLAHGVGRTLSRRNEPQQIGGALLVDVDLSNAPFASLEMPPGVDRLLVRAWLDGQVVSYTERLPLTEVIDGRVILDAALEQSAWPALEHFVLQPLLASLRVTRNGTVERGGVRLGQISTDAAAPTERELLDAAGWALFLQEVFGDAKATNDDVYAGRVRGRPAQLLDGERVSFDVTAGPVELRTTQQVVRFDVALGGERLDQFDLVPIDGRITAGRLRSQLAIRQGLELVRVAMRAFLSRPPDDRGGPTSAFGGRLGALSETDLVAQPMATGWPLPASHAIHAAPPEVRRPLPKDAVRPDPRDAQLPVPGPALRTAASFEALFTSDEDPWRYETGYETVKYEQTLSLLPSSLPAVLELACAEGHFTTMLAGTAKRVVATDVSSLALERARGRCAGLEHVEFRQHDLFTDPIDGRWPAIVCSEVLYYARQVDDLVPVVRRIFQALEPGGILVTAHANLVVDDPTAPGFDWSEAYGSLGIQRAILATGIAALEEEIVTPMYRVQRYRRTSRFGARIARPVKTTRGTVSPDLSPDARAHFLPAGGQPAGASNRSEPAPQTVPILMYHRVAPDGSEQMRRWRVTPEELDEQLAFLTRAGFTSISLGEWRDAALLGRPLPAQPVVLTFDDGYADFAEHAQPALERHGFGATIFLVADLIGRDNAWARQRDKPISLMDWDTILDLESRGVGIGAHTRSHQPLTSLSAEAAYDEIARSFTTLAERLARPPVAFAYPYGDLSAGIRSLTGLAGAHVAVTCEDRFATDQDDVLLLPRIEVRGDGDPVRDLVRRLGNW